MSTVTNDRWSKAQAYEAEWWDTRRHDMELEYYKNYADDIKERVRPFITLEHATHILEVGSGAAGIITHFTECDFRYAIDPLEDFYASIPEFAAYRDKRVEYMTAMGEHLAFRDGFFDLVIMDNVLDHCKEPDRVMGEIHRVMKSGGIVFFRQNIYHLWGKFVRSLMEAAEIDRGHPHTFTRRSIRQLLRDKRFQILTVDNPGYWKTWGKEIASKNTKDLVKALLFATRNKVSYILRND
jgi:ubiquinone/menaquinone biosynthesis C-methylase UbiE